MRGIVADTVYIGDVVTLSFSNHDALRLWSLKCVIFKIAKHTVDHFGFMQITQIPQSGHTVNRWIYTQWVSISTNPPKKLIVLTILGLTFGLIQPAILSDHI